MMCLFRLSIILASISTLLLLFAGADAYSICSNPSAYQGRVVDDPRGVTVNIAANVSLLSRYNLK